MRHRSTIGSGSLLNCLNQFLTPDVWRQAKRVPGARRRSALVEPSSAHLCVAGPDVVYRQTPIPECFETSSGPEYVACYQCRKRPGTSLVHELSQSLDRRCFFGTCPAEGLAAGSASPHFSRSSATACSIEAFIPSGCEHWLAHGMSAHCRSGATHGKGRQRRFEAHAVADGHRPSPLRLAAAATVGVAPWAKAPPAEQMHLIHLLATLPARSLLVTDAGYIGYELLVAMTTAKVQHT